MLTGTTGGTTADPTSADPTSGGRSAVPARGDRGTGLLLALGTAAVLAVGGWWWVAAAPAPAVSVAEPPVVPQVVPSVGPSDLFFLIDPETGEVVVPDAGNVLPEFPGTVRRDLFSVHEGTSTDWPVPVEPGGRYLLQYVCTGPGELTIRVDGIRTGKTETALVCGDGFTSTEVTAADARMVIQVSRSRPQPGRAEVAIQLLALS
ncbi:hypothetical protein [Micromonospora sp. NPDC004704]